MKSALGFDAPIGDPRGEPFAPRVDRYTIVGKLRSAGRAEVSIGLPVGARSSDELVVIKTYQSPAPEAAQREIPPEVDVASTPRHYNLARVFECGREAGRHFIVSEYLEGITLRRVLRWLAARDEKLPDAAVTRILLGLFAAVEHANHWARTPQARALVHQPIDASDVFITYAGEVKVLGFKPARKAAELSEPVEPAAVDELLSTQRSPALGAALAGIGKRVSTASLIGLWQVARMLKNWQRDELRSDGLAELAAIMARVQPEGRAARRKQLDVAVARVMRARDEAESSADAAPVSGYRVAGSSEVSIIRPELVRSDSDAAAALVVRGPEAVSLLQRVRLLPPPLPSALVPLLPSARTPLLPSAQWAPRASPLPSAPKPRRRNVPWASLVMLVGVLTAALAVVKHRSERATSAPPAPAPLAPALMATPAEPRVAPALGVIARPPPLANEPSTPPLASEPSPPPALDAAPATLASAPARAVRSTGNGPASSAPRRSHARVSRAARASIARAVVPATPPGFLTLDTTPWSTVSAGSALLGQTPLVKVELAAGQHLLELANEELGISTSIVVEITSGATTVRRIGLERPIHAARQ